MSLKKAALSGVKWSSLLQVGRQIIQFVTTAILARLLSPTDFGLVGMATIVIGFVNLFKDLGTSSAIIQRKNISDELIYSLFWINVAFGLLGTIVLFSGAPMIAKFYQEPRLTPILRTLSLSFFISGLSILQKALLERNLNFKTLAKIDIVALFLGSSVGIILALNGYGVWSLVFQTLTAVTITSILLWIANKWQPKFVFRWQEIKEISDYSLNLTGFNIFNYFVRNADYFLIGKFLGSQSLGYYSLAYRLMLYPLQNISKVIGRVMFPVFTKIQDDDAKLKAGYLKVIGYIAIVTFPLMVGLWVSAEPFILTMFGSQWQPVVLLLMILTPVGMVQSIETTLGQIYQIKERTDLMFRWSICEGTLLVIAWAIGLQWGIVGVATSYSLMYFALIYPNFSIPFSLIDLSIFKLAAVLWRQVVASLLMLIVLLGTKLLLPINLAGGWVLAILILTGGIAYFLASWSINRKQIQQLLETVGVKR